MIHKFLSILKLYFSKKFGNHWHKTSTNNPNYFLNYFFAEFNAGKCAESFYHNSIGRNGQVNSNCIHICMVCLNTLSIGAFHQAIECPLGKQNKKNIISNLIFTNKKSDTLVIRIVSKILSKIIYFLSSSRPSRRTWPKISLQLWRHYHPTHKSC